MKKANLVVVVVVGLALVTPLTVGATGMNDFLDHTNEVIALEKQIALEGHMAQYVKAPSVASESVEEVRDLIVEEAPNVPKIESSEATEVLLEPQETETDNVEVVLPEVEEPIAFCDGCGMQTTECECAELAEEHCEECGQAWYMCGCDIVEEEELCCQECGREICECETNG